MGILPEHTYEIRDATYEGIQARMFWLCNRVVVQTKILTDATGIIGIRCFLQGLSWKILKPSAMKLVAPFYFVVIDLNTKDQKLLNEFI